MFLEGRKILTQRFRRGRAAWATAAGVAGLLGVAAAGGGCSESFGAAPSCEESRTCPVPPEGGSSNGGSSNGGSSNNEPEGGDAPGGTTFGGEAGAGGANATCEADLTACGAECVDTGTNPAHCGACGNVCRGASICTEGACVACPARNIRCDGECVDPTLSSAFCGARGDCLDEHRGVVCEDGTACSEGVCAADDANLASLSLEPAALSPEFDPETSTYTASFSFFEPRLILKAAPADAQASATYEAVSLKTSEVEIFPGAEDAVTSLSVEVTAVSGKKQSYDIELEQGTLATTYVKAFNSRAGFGFGNSVAIDGDTVVVGALTEDGYGAGIDGNEGSSGNTGAGAAYVAVLDKNGKWTRQAYLKSDAPGKFDGFGESVAIDGDTIAVGSPGDSNHGAVFIFVRRGSKWSQQAKLTEPGSPSDENGAFGRRVALRGDRLIVSATLTDVVNIDSGYVYAFTRQGTTWKEGPKPTSGQTVKQHPVPADATFTSQDIFGSSLALDGERLAIAEEQGTGSIFMMLHSSTGWLVENQITMADGALARARVALEGDTLAAALPTGSVYIFERTGSTWTRRSTLTAFDPAATDGFGTSVALKNGLLVVGSGCIQCAGGISTFIKSADGWVNGTFVSVPNLDPTDGFGAAVAISGNRIVAGAPLEDSKSNSFNQSGANNDARESGAAFILE